MKIAFFTDTYYPQVNGVVTSIGILKSQLERLGHKVVIITVKVPNADSETDVIRLSSITFPMQKEHRVAMFYSYRTIRMIKREKFDLIHTHTEFSIGTFGRIVAGKLNLPLVHTYHTMYEDYTHYVTKGVGDRYAVKLVRKLSRIICNKSDCVIAPSEKTSGILKDYGVQSKLNVIPTGIDIKRFYPDSEIYNSFRDKLGISRSVKILLFVGRLAKEKNINVLIKAMPEIVKVNPEIFLVIAGDGDEKFNLENLSMKLRISENIVFTGEVKYTEIDKYYKMADFFISASTSETQGLTYIEALASGLPVIAKYDSNLENVVEDKYNGCFFDSDSELPEVVLQAVSANDLTLWRNNAVKSAEKFSDTAFGQKVEKLYYSQLKQKLKRVV
ncbi:glycosyltransferase family 4 protein [Flexistipes sp.]|uniref:glycosyltransferase family 4 protein n=1 Tax=Flexistipes sp. TaxID=3088135 RepID=UPI002E21DD76|nr:glycosyltransferase family 4 protein [Flexistipes sp.]